MKEHPVFQDFTSLTGTYKNELLTSFCKYLSICLLMQWQIRPSFRTRSTDKSGSWPYSRAGHLHCTGGPHNSLRTLLRAALVYANIEEGGELHMRPLFVDN